MKFGLLLLYFLVSSSLISCSERSSSELDQQLNATNQLLNENRYEEAIEYLEGLLEEKPMDQALNTKLCHALAGAGGFDAVKIVRLIDEFKTTFINGEVQEFLVPIETFLADLPSLSNVQNSRLDQSIIFCNQIRMEILLPSNENNIKQGLLHAYRLLNTIDETLQLVASELTGQSNHSNSFYDHFYATRILVMWQDMEHIYEYYGSSNDHLRHNVQKIDTAFKSMRGQ